MSAVLNYSTSVPTNRTVAEIQHMLGEAGAARVTIEYSGGRPAGFSFSLTTPHGPRVFTLPVDVDAMHRLLVDQEAMGKLRTGTKAGRSNREQAERVAWRVLRDWLAAQLAIVASQMAKLDQVMLPYLQVDLDRTLYEAYRDREQVLAIEAAR